MQEVSKMRVMITRFGEFKGIYTVDMFYQGKIPYAVFEWAEDSTAEIRAFLLAYENGQNDFFQGLFL